MVSLGRYHRYGQKDEAMASNFSNRKNAADQRVYERLRIDLVESPLPQIPRKRHFYGRTNMPSAIRHTIAFWITPDGVTHLVPSTHIQFVIEHPDMFCISLDDLRQRYLEQNEPWGSEGVARHTTICELVKKGWIRIRRYPQDYSVNVPELDDVNRDVLAQFANRLLNEGFEGRYESDTYMPMRIVEMNNGKSSSIPLGKVACLSEVKFSP